MQLNDWLLLTSIACLMVATVYVAYILRNVQRKLEKQTNQIRQMKEYQATALEQASIEVSSTYLDIKQKVKLGWRIVSFLTKRRQRKKIKKGS